VNKSTTEIFVTKNYHLVVITEPRDGKCKVTLKSRYFLANRPDALRTIFDVMLGEEELMKFKDAINQGLVHLAMSKR
jgi:hypothetical protein